MNDQQEALEPQAPEEMDLDISVEDELDLTDAGLQPHRAVFEVLSSEKQQKDNGQLVVLRLRGISEGLDSNNLTAVETFWLSHKNPDASRIGRGRFKGVLAAVYGGPKGSIAGLAGHYVSAWCKERDGRPTLTQFQKPSDEELDRISDEESGDL